MRGWVTTAATSLVFVVGCGGSNNSPTPSLSVVEVTVTGPSTLGAIGESAQFAATARYSNGTTQDLTGSAQWSTTDPAVVSIPVGGKATATGGGSASVRATLQQITGSKQIQVILGPPVPNAATTGRIENLQTAADLIAYHQDAIAGSAFRITGVISRWELPIRVYVDSPATSSNVERALAYWQSVTGLPYVMVTNSDPRILVRATTDGLSGSAEGGGVIDATYSNNQARSGFVRIRPDLAACDFSQTSCSSLYERALGNVLGLFGQVPGGISFAGSQATVREINMLVELYRLPHGTHIDADGTWKVIR